MRTPQCWLLALLGIAVSAVAQSAAPPRTWSTTEGKTFQATLVSVNGTQITLRLGNGQMAAIGLQRLSPADQTYLQSLSPASGGAPPAANASAGRGPIEKRVWPQKVEVDTRAIDVAVVSEDVANLKCVYRSRNFEFTAEDKLAPSVLKELARTFESTRSLIEALPWSIEPKPAKGPGLFPAKFLATRESYVAAGGNPKSSGMFLFGDATFIVPFDGIGLERRGKTWAKSGKYEDASLVHEITHQMMYSTYRLLPEWVWEGAAEYARMLPNNAGVVLAGSHERGMKEHFKRKTEAGYKPSDAGAVLELMQLPMEGWSQRIKMDDKIGFHLQFTSALLIYYFCHLDGDGKGARFVRYMDKIAETREAGTSPGTRGSYGLAQLDLLLEGRNKDEIQKAVVDGFKKIGVRWE